MPLTFLLWSTQERAYNAPTMNTFQQITGYVEHVKQQQSNIVIDGIALADRCGESV